jgi:hypothetical protein
MAMKNSSVLLFGVELRNPAERNQRQMDSPLLDNDDLLDDQTEQPYDDDVVINLRDALGEFDTPAADDDSKSSGGGKTPRKSKGTHTFLSGDKSYAGLTA